MNARGSWLISIGVGAFLGYLFGVQRGDLWIGGVLAVVSAIAGYGILAYPEYRTRWSAPEGYSRFWYSLIGGLGPIIMLITPNSTLLSDELPVVVFLGCLWLGGVSAGIALARESPVPTDN